MNNVGLYTVLLHHHVGVYAQVIAAGESPESAQSDAAEHFKALANDKAFSVLATFDGAVMPQTRSAAFHPDKEILVTEAARAADLRIAREEMLDWERVHGEQFVASVSPPEELENSYSPEAVTIYHEDGKWWLSQSNAAAQSDYVLLAQAVAAGNREIEKIRKDFVADAPAAA